MIPLHFSRNYCYFSQKNLNVSQHQSPVKSQCFQVFCECNVAFFYCNVALNSVLVLITNVRIKNSERSPCLEDCQLPKSLRKPEIHARIGKVFVGFGISTFLSISVPYSSCFGKSYSIKSSATLSVLLVHVLLNSAVPFPYKALLYMYDES